MNDPIKFNMEGLNFFGKVNASISHELKNILAIISETAGLLQDLTDLARQGKELRLSTLEGCTQSIAEDIQRGFATIKKMNQFAHSVDRPVKEIDLYETVQLTANLTQFLSFASQVQIKNDTAENPSILTCPFLLENLIYQILLFAYEPAGPDGEINIQIVSQKEGYHLVFSNKEKAIWNHFPTPKIKETAEILGITLPSNPSLSEIDLWIPCISNEIVSLAKKLQPSSQPETKNNMQQSADKF